jgi:DNA repair protein RecO (recombination protein O)
MAEYFTWGIVLRKEPIGEADNEYSVFTWDMGKIKARASGSRKILSRLAGHLEPGTIANIRVARKNEEGRFIMAEALREERNKSSETIRVLSLAESLIPLEQPDINMFSFLKSLITEGETNEANSYARLLKLAGFDPDSAVCGICGKHEIAYFSPKDIMFLCVPCLKKRTKSQ